MTECQRDEYIRTNYLYKISGGQNNHDGSTSSFGTMADDSSICEARTAPINRSGSSSVVFA